MLAVKKHEAGEAPDNIVIATTLRAIFGYRKHESEFTARHALVLATHMTPEQLRLRNEDGETAVIETLNIHEMASEREAHRQRNAQAGASKSCTPLR